MTEPTQATLEDMIFRMWDDCINSVENLSDVPIEAIQKLIDETRKIASEAGWPATYSHNFFVALKNELKAKTLGHRTTRQIISLLEIETEFN